MYLTLDSAPRAPHPTLPASPPHQGSPAYATPHSSIQAPLHGCSMPGVPTLSLPPTQGSVWGSGQRHALHHSHHSPAHLGPCHLPPAIERHRGPCPSCSPAVGQQAPDPSSVLLPAWGSGQAHSRGPHLQVLLGSLMHLLPQGCRTRPQAHKRPASPDAHRQGGRLAGGSGTGRGRLGSPARPRGSVSRWVSAGWCLPTVPRSLVANPWLTPSTPCFHVRWKHSP